MKLRLVIFENVTVAFLYTSFLTRAFSIYIVFLLNRIIVCVFIFCFDYSLTCSVVDICVIYKITLSK